MLGSLKAGPGRLCSSLTRWCHVGQPLRALRHAPFTAANAKPFDGKRRCSDGRGDVQANAQAQQAEAVPAPAKGRKVGVSEAQDGSAKGMIDTNPPKGTLTTLACPRISSFGKQSSRPSKLHAVNGMMLKRQRLHPARPARVATHICSYCCIQCRPQGRSRRTIVPM